MKRVKQIAPINKEGTSTKGKVARLKGKKNLPKLIGITGMFLRNGIKPKVLGSILTCTTLFLSK